MPQPEEVEKTWFEFLDTTESLFELDARPFDQFLHARRKALALAREERVAKGIVDGFLPPHSNASEMAPIRDALFAEFESFVLAWRVSQKTKKKRNRRKWLPRLRSIGKTVLGSAKDILDLNPYAAGVLTLLTEAFDFSAKD